MNVDGRKARIILIGGIPGVGKSSISGYLARNLGIDIVLSGDYLREFVRPLCSPEHNGLLNMSVYESWKFFGDETKKNIEKGFLAQGELLNRGLNAVLNRAVENGEPMIVETLYFIPGQIEQKILHKIMPLYLYISDKDLNSQRLLERQQYTHFKSSGQRLSDQLARYRVMMEYSLSESKKYGIPVFDNINYNDTREHILEYIRSKD